jgi:hypothetical protein
VAVARSVVGEIVVGTTAHADEVVARDAATLEAFWEQRAEEQREIAEVLQQQTTFPLGVCLQGVAIEFRKRLQRHPSRCIREQPVAAAESFEQTAEVPTGILLRRRAKSLRMIAESLPEVIGERRCDDGHRGIDHEGHLRLLSSCFLYSASQYAAKPPGGTRFSLRWRRCSRNATLSSLPSARAMRDASEYR